MKRRQLQIGLALYPQAMGPVTTRFPPNPTNFHLLFASDLQQRGGMDRFMNRYGSNFWEEYIDFLPETSTLTPLILTGQFIPQFYCQFDH
jgi:hypothetical protein